MKRATLILSTFLISIVPAFAKTFSDVSEKNPYFNATYYLSQKGIINGYSDGTFKPYNEINRAELLKILLEGTGIEVVTPQTHCFPDVPYNEWYSGYICTAKSLGFIEGYPGGNFRPAQKINKVEAIKILGEIYNWPLTLSSNFEPFLDTPQDQWYIPYLEYAKGKGLLPETGAYYKPATEISRGAVAETLYRYLVITELSADTFTDVDKSGLEDLLESLQDNVMTDIAESSEKSANTKIIADGEFTISLTFISPDEENPSDLDGHLLLPSDEEIYFTFKIASDLSAIMEAKNNQERITVRDLQDGGYEFFVHNFSNTEDFSEIAAIVEINDKNGLAGIYFAPEGEGKIWKVFEINQNREITDINQIGDCELIEGVSAVCPES